MNKKYIAEFIGTFTLAFLVILSLNNPFMPTPIVASLTLMLFVYLIGTLSGCHINPAVTIGLCTLQKITPKESTKYIVAQLLGAAVALGLTQALGISVKSPTLVNMQPLVFEFLGMILFTFGIGAVVFNKAKNDFNGFIIGLSLLLGILISVLGGAAGILNPAVALALKTTWIGYYVAEILGGIIGFNLAKFLFTDVNGK